MMSMSVGTGLFAGTLGGVQGELALKRAESQTSEADPGDRGDGRDDFAVAMNAAAGAQAAPDSRSDQQSGPKQTSASENSGSSSADKTGAGSGSGDGTARTGSEQENAAGRPTSPPAGADGETARTSDPSSAGSTASADRAAVSASNGNRNATSQEAAPTNPAGATGMRLNAETGLARGAGNPAAPSILVLDEAGAGWNGTSSSEGAGGQAALNGARGSGTADSAAVQAGAQAGGEAARSAASLEEMASRAGVEQMDLRPGGSVRGSGLQAASSHSAATSAGPEGNPAMAGTGASGQGSQVSAASNAMADDAADASAAEAKAAGATGQAAGKGNAAQATGKVQGTDGASAQSEMGKAARAAGRMKVEAATASGARSEGGSAVAGGSAETPARPHPSQARAAQGSQAPGSDQAGPSGRTDAVSTGSAGREAMASTRNRAGADAGQGRSSATAATTPAAARNTSGHGVSEASSRTAGGSGTTGTSAHAAGAQSSSALRPEGGEKAPAGRDAGRSQAGRTGAGDVDGRGLSEAVRTGRATGSASQGSETPPATDSKTRETDGVAGRAVPKSAEEIGARAAEGQAGRSARAEEPARVSGAGVAHGSDSGSDRAAGNRFAQGPAANQEERQNPASMADANREATAGRAAVQTGRDQSGAVAQVAAPADGMDKEPVAQGPAAGRPRPGTAAQSGAVTTGQAQTSTSLQGRAARETAETGSAEWTMKAGAQETPAVQEGGLRSGQFQPVAAPAAQAHGQTAAPAPAGQAGAALPRVMELTEMPEFLPHTLQAAAREGVREANIRLWPPELGGLRVQLQVNGNEVTVRIQVERPEVGAMLDRMRGALQRGMQEAGLILHRMEIDLSGTTLLRSSSSSGTSLEGRGADSSPRDGLGFGAGSQGGSSSDSSQGSRGDQSARERQDAGSSSASIRGAGPGSRGSARRSAPAGGVDAWA